MATTTYTIYSRYDPATQRERLERETGQLSEDVDPWEAEANATFKRKLAPPPRFVPAGSSSTTPAPSASTSSSTASDVASWYKSLTQTTNTAVTCPAVASAGPSTQPAAPRVREKRSKNNWFIMNAIATEPALPTANTSSTTLADILARDPPPLPHEQQYSPPVWLALGPTNKGFEMLQNSGWTEGEALGSDIARPPTARKEVPPKQQPVVVKKEEPDTPQSLPDEVIDLTMSDSESSDGEREDDSAIAASASVARDPLRKALVTPIATVLKSDRLGIGLKAKTTGPHRASQKRITHNAAAMQAHTKAAEELRKQKQTNGRGHRAFARQNKAEAANRKRLLAYMNEH